jgi:hypothetical protein
MTSIHYRFSRCIAFELNLVLNTGVGVLVVSGTMVDVVVVNTTVDVVVMNTAIGVVA